MKQIKITGLTWMTDTEYEVPATAKNRSCYPLKKTKKSFPAYASLSLFKIRKID
jgi:hypothetical protein